MGSIGGEDMEEEGAQACRVGDDLGGEVFKVWYECGVEWQEDRGVYLPVGGMCEGGGVRRSGPCGDCVH